MFFHRIHRMETLIFVVIVFIASLECVYSFNVFNVVDYGAVGDGKTDDSQAFVNAWEATCNFYGVWPTLYVPPGKTFLVKPVRLLGPCKAITVHVQVLGNLVGPNNIQAWDGAPQWLLFHDIHGISLFGSGRIGGQGPIWWACKRANKCSMPPTAIAFSHCDDLKVHGLKFFNNPRNHISINGCNRVHISNVVITAPKDSPNTDGINVGSSSHVNIWKSIIGTGDDCISVLSGTSNVNISQITCGPGHGISIGSLGSDGSFAAVDQIHVSQSTFIGTTNGARIKTWQGGFGYARGISFEHIRMKSVDYPIVIDQYYCFDANCKNKTAAVEVSNLKFADIQGTSSGEVAVHLACSETVACRNVVLADVQLLPERRGKKISTYCLNAHGPSCSSCTPRVPCLG